MDAAAARGNGASEGQTLEEPTISEERASSTEVNHRPSVLPEVPEGTEASNLLLAFAVLGGCLTIILLLAGSSRPLYLARSLLALAALGALSAQYLLRTRDFIEPHPLIALGAPTLAVIAALGSTLVTHPLTDMILNLTGTILLAQAAGMWLSGRLRLGLVSERAQLEARLDVRCLRLNGDELVETRASELHPGEEVLLTAGQVSPADVTITSGSAEVKPWLDAKHTLTVEKGNALVAGAKVVEGQLRAIVAWAGDDRAWLRLTVDRGRRADLWASMARMGRLLGERGAPTAALLAAVLALAAGSDLLITLSFAATAFALLSNVAASELAASITARSVFGALKHGIAFKNAQAFDRTGKVTSAVFCARGTLLLGEPEVTNVEAFGHHQEEQVLSLLAGAEATFSGPVAHAISRAVRARGIRPNAVRVPALVPGLGVTAVTSSGEPLCVGSRALMLRERISIAFAEARISDLEAMGRSVILVAQNGHLIGAVGLQDGLRPGARAAVQHLLDVGVEPILLSADSRDTCQALGRALDIEHIRPEVLPPEASEVVQRLTDGGAVVAVVGNSPVDDACLSTAPVSVVLGSAGSGTAEWSVQLASDDVRDAALAVRVAHRARVHSLEAMLTCFVPAILLAVTSALGLVSLVAAPLLSLLAVGVAVFRYRTSRSAGTPQ